MAKRTSTTAEVEKFDPSQDYRTYEPRSFEVTPSQVMVVPIIDKTLAKCEGANRRAFVPPSREGGERKKFCVHPSQSSGCRRQVQFIVLNAQRDITPPDPRKWRVFDIGHESHRRIQGYLFEAWNLKINGVTRVWEDVKLVYPELLVSGELDAIVQIRNWRIVIEVKTAGKSVYEGLRAPKKAWVWQAHIYMRAVGLLGAILLVECRDNGMMQEFWVPFDEEIWDEIEGDTIEVLAAIEAEELAQANPDPGDCMWCNYRALCKDTRMQAKIDWKVLAA